MEHWTVTAFPKLVTYEYVNQTHIVDVKYGATNIAAYTTKGWFSIYS